jgi:hypothetical protein
MIKKYNPMKKHLSAVRHELHLLTLGKALLLSAWGYGQNLDCTITASANPICLGVYSIK